MSTETLLVYGGTREERRAMQRLLAGAGFRVLLASSMAEAAKALAGDQVRAIVMAEASAGDEGEREPGRSAWRERGIPIIDVVNDNRSRQTSTMDIALLDVVRNALAASREPSTTPRP
jgi:NAD(P)-dependent dehydrogenase (short-subunit alcohol dehydrogenase family)